VRVYRLRLIEMGIMMKFSNLKLKNKMFSGNAIELATLVKVLTDLVSKLKVS